MKTNKKNLFLSELKKSYKEFNELETHFGSGIKKRIKRLISYPDIYIPYALIKLGLPIKKRKKIKLFNKNIKLNITKNNFGGLVFLSKFRCLPEVSEYKLSKFLIKNLRENDIFYDIGANYGFYTYLAMEFCKEVHTFEPLPDVYSNLIENLKNYKNIFLNNLALSNKNGFAYLSSAGENSSIVDKIKKIKKNKEIKIKTISLDYYIYNESFKKTPTVLKIDAEGSESLIIEGEKKFFESESPIIAMEVWSKENGGEISEEAVNKLKKLGYKSYFINFDGELIKTKDNLSNLIFSKGMTGDNFIFKK